MFEDEKTNLSDEGLAEDSKQTEDLPEEALGGSGEEAEGAGSTDPGGSEQKGMANFLS